MAKIIITGLENVTPAIKRKIAQSIAKSNFADQMTVELRDEIQENGIGDDLTLKTIFNRIRLEQYNETDPKYVAGFSNLTFTGKLLKSLKTKFVTSKLIFNILSSDKRHPKYKKGGKSSASMNQIFEYQKKYNRDIGKVFERKSFTDKLSQLLRDSIYKFYKN